MQDRSVENDRQCWTYSQAPAEGEIVITTAADSSLLLTVQEAAQLLRISRNLAYELVARGELPAVRLGRLIRVPRHGLEKWIALQSGLPDAPPPVASFNPQLD